MSLQELFTKLEGKYKNIAYNLPHILKSLIYFADAEEQPMHKDITWEQTKSYITEQVKKITFSNQA
jgi:hypothetical protein